MIKKGQRVDLGRLFTSGSKVMKSEKMFSVFKRKITESISSKEPDEILFFDLFAVNAIPKITIAEEILELFNANSYRDGSIFFYNASDELYTSLQQPMFSSKVMTRSFLIPFILTSGRWKWLGVPSDLIEDALNLLVRNQFLSSDFLQTYLNISDAQLELLRAVVDANPAFFIYDYKKAIMRCKFNVNDLLSLLIEKERDVIGRAFLDNDLILSGHFALPSGYHINKCVLTSHISRDQSLADRIYAQVVRHTWASSPDVVITSSLFSFMIGERIRKEQGQRVLNTFGYPIPRPRYGETTEPGERVFLLSDIYSTGSALNHIRKQVLSNQGIIIGAMSIVDAHGYGELDEVKSSIKLELQLKSEGKCPSCKQNKNFQFIDPFSCLPYKTPSSPKAPKGILEPNEFWNLLREKNAILGNKNEHVIYNGNHFTLFIETRKVLRDSIVSRELAASALSAVGPNFDAILIPKNEGALLLAHGIQKYLQHHFNISLEIIPCSKDHERNVFVVPDFIQKSLKNSSLLIVDDGANTGGTLLGLHFAVQAFKPKNIKYLVFLDRLFGTDRQNIQTILGSHYHCLFHLAVPVYREWDCPVCFEQESQAFYTRGQHDNPSEQILPSRSAGPRKVTKLIWEADR